MSIKKWMTAAEAGRLGRVAGVEAVQVLLGEQGWEDVVATLKPGCIGWDEPARNAHAAEIDGVPPKLADRYYDAYAEAARLRAEEIRAEGRGLTNRERARIRASAFAADSCGDDAGAKAVVLGACDVDEWSEEALAEAVQTAREAWDAPRGSAAGEGEEDERADYVDGDGDCVECGHPADNSSGWGTCDSPAHDGPGRAT